MIRFQTSRFACPSCGEPLRRMTVQSGRVLVWCSYGRCPSASAGNDGAYGDTEDEAFGNLRTAIEAEDAREQV